MKALLLAFLVVSVLCVAASGATPAPVKASTKQYADSYQSGGQKQDSYYGDSAYDEAYDEDKKPDDKMCPDAKAADEVKQGGAGTEGGPHRSNTVPAPHVYCRSPLPSFCCLPSSKTGTMYRYWLRPASEACPETYHTASFVACVLLSCCSARGARRFPLGN